MTMMRLRREDPRVVGSFKLHRRLGAGGMGVVYLGSDRRGQRVALKLIRPELAEDQEFRSRFAREVSAASRIRGGCTARLVAADLEAERPWLATQYVPGPSLYDKVNGGGPLTAAEVAAIGAALAEGLVAVHEAGVVHRDLKPSNILLSPKGPRIIDFGIAWATGASTLTHVGTAVGSPGFLAPEQVRGATVTPATDVFAFGATLAYAASADSPFGQGSSEVMLYRVVHEEPSLRGVPGALAPLIQSCLAKDPEDRPSTTRLHERLREIHLRETRGLDHPGRGYIAPEQTTADRPRSDRRGPDRLPREGQTQEGTAGYRTPPSQGKRYPQQRTERRGGYAPTRQPDVSHPPGGVPPSGGARPVHRPAPGKARRTPVPSRTAVHDRGLLRQRLVVFVTVTVLVALGIALAQGCQGRNEAVGPSTGGGEKARAADGKRARNGQREGEGNVAPPGPDFKANPAHPLTLTRASTTTEVPSVDWRNRGYTGPDDPQVVQLRDGRWRGTGGDTVRLSRLIDARLDRRPAQIVVLTRSAGPVREHLVELFAFDGGEAVLVASHVARARPGGEYRWRIADGVLLREQRPPADTPGTVLKTAFTPLHDGTFLEKESAGASSRPLP